MRNPKHLCAEDTCLCPVHQTAMYWWPKGGLHACQDRECRYARGIDLDRELGRLVMEAYHRHKDQQERERQEQRALEAQLWSELGLSTPDSWQLIPSPMWQHVKDMYARWPQVPLWREDRFRRERQGRWLTYPPEEDDDEE